MVVIIDRIFYILEIAVNLVKVEEEIRHHILITHAQGEGLVKAEEVVEGTPQQQ